MQKMCLLLLWKSERRKNNCYLVFAVKNEVAFAQEAHVPIKEPQNNRRLSE